MASAAKATAEDDDRVVPFQTARSGIVGRIVRLGSTVDDVLSKHDYPDAVSVVLGEALALTAMLGSNLKFNGRLILQTKSDGPIGMLVVQYEVPGRMRGYASFDADRVREVTENGGMDLLGTGHLAMTIDPGADMDRYQGIVALEGQSLSDAAHTYFRQSEQLPTYMRLAVARHHAPAGPGSPHVKRWRAGGLMIQSIATTGGTDRPELSDEEHDARLVGDDENWNRTRILAATVEDHELLDPTLPPERLLYRLFHEEGVGVSPSQHVAAVCTCSQERIEALLERFADDNLDDMREGDGTIAVTCEFCSTKYRVAPFRGS